MPVPRAQLRVFVPLDTFHPTERERWASQARQGRGLTRAEVAAQEAGAATARLLTGRAAHHPDAALIRRVGTRVMICPLDLELRTAQAFDAFERSIPEVVSEAFVPDEASRSRLAELARTSRVPHVVDAAWAVPLHWFVAFEPSERRFLHHPEGVGARLVYLTTAGQALVRLGRAIAVVESTIEDGDDLLLMLADLATWVDAFDPSSLVELDYGGVAGRFPAEQLQDDHTCADLWGALDALEAGDPLAAAAGYAAARARWRRHQTQTHAS